MIDGRMENEGWYSIIWGFISILCDWLNYLSCEHEAINYNAGLLNCLDCQYDMAKYGDGWSGNRGLNNNIV